MTARRLSQLLAFALAAFTYWMMVSRPGVVGDEFVGTIYAGFFVVILVVFGLSFLALHLAAGGTATYWTQNRTDQVRPILLMEVATVTMMLAANVAFHGLGREGPASAMVAYLVTGMLVPAACLGFGLVAWPSRSGRPGPLRLFLIAGLAIGLAAAWSYAGYSIAPDRVDLPPLPDLIVAVGAVVFGATFEEIVFRVLLLTALIARTGSRFQAVFLSSVAFGLMHVPGVLADPVIHGDWALLQQVAFDYAPEFLVTTFIGLLLGVLWLRTGSITLIVVTHAVLNMGGVLAYGLLA